MLSKWRCTLNVYDGEEEAVFRQGWIWKEPVAAAALADCVLTGSWRGEERRGYKLLYLLVFELGMEMRL